MNRLTIECNNKFKENEYEIIQIHCMHTDNLKQKYNENAEETIQIII